MAGKSLKWPFWILTRQTRIPAFHGLEIALLMLIRTRDRDHLPGGEVDERADMVDRAMPKQTGEKGERV